MQNTIVGRLEARGLQKNFPSGGIQDSITLALNPAPLEESPSDAACGLSLERSTVVGLLRYPAFGWLGPRGSPMPRMGPIYWRKCPGLEPREYSLAQEATLTIRY